MKIVTMKQLRQKFGPVRKGLDRGEEYLLMYRSKPLAVIRPYSVDTDAEHLKKTEKVADTKVHAASDTTSNPLEKLGMKKAFL